MADVIDREVELADGQVLKGQAIRHGERLRKQRIEAEIKDYFENLDQRGVGQLAEEVRANSTSDPSKIQSEAEYKRQAAEELRKLLIPRR